MKKGIIFLLLFNIFFGSSYAQNCTSMDFPNGHIYTIDRFGTSITFPINYLPNSCTVNLDFVDQNLESLPSWLLITAIGNSITISAGENLTGSTRSIPAILCRNVLNNQVLSGFQVIQTACDAWYPDEDGDGFGNQYASPIFSCSPIDGMVENNNDACPEEAYTNNSGCEPGYVHEDMNWIMNKAYDINGNLKAAGKSYFDALGKGIQSQTLDVETDKTWATETRYDAQGRPALQSLSAPIGKYADNSDNFIYNTGFIKNESGNDYTEADFETNPENPTKVGSAPNTLGHYYSQNNTDTNYEGNSYQDVTDYPFSRTIYSELNLGAAIKTIGGKQLDLNIETKSYRFSMPASQELSQTNAFNHTKYDNIKTIKTVVRNAHGIEAVVFTDTDGKTLAAARSGNEENANIDIRDNMQITIKEQGFVDIHIPVGCTGFDIDNPSNKTIAIYNLITEAEETGASESLSNGFYRVSIIDLENYLNNVQVTYKENYYDYSLNEYDKAGRLLATYQPLEKLKSEFKYNALGQLTYTKSPDEGEARFKYRKDGQIRFSQNSKQLAAGEYSFTNYDNLGRPTDSGVAAGNFETTNPDNTTPVSGNEQNFTTYDGLNQVDLDILATLDASYHHPTFLAGNVAKSNTADFTSYYSYDIYGRVKWMVQNSTGLGLKTIDYKYDPITGSVLEVDYQRHISAERFVHQYTYNFVDQLTEVKTSTDGTTFTNQAKYSYYETGALKRTELADNLQGIDYIYNLAGQLKAINHPSGEIANDPGGDGNNGFSQDVFSMTLDYFTGDYKRSNTPTEIHAVTEGIDQYNGNIKAMTWKINGSNTPETETYYYQYNKNNWLTSAGLGGLADGTGAVIDHITKNAEITANGQVLATTSITLAPGFYVAAGTEYLAKIDPNATSSGDDGDYNVSNLTYDANGNIKTLNRNKNTKNGSNAMDQLTYKYYDDPNDPNNDFKPNQLKRVNDNIGEVADADDIGDQSGDNYTYNEIGQLVHNAEEGISYKYNASGLVVEVQHDNQPVVKFYYNDRGHRAKKESYTNGTLTNTSYYVRDAAGSTLAIYNNTTLVEQPIYGASRLGIHYRAGNNDVYQLTDHLGNVRAVIARNNPTPSTTTDYYPFGMPMPNRRTIGGETYRYAFQGQEKDTETGKEAFELRLWDSRIGRWLTTDPAGQFYSPYLGMGNNPINGTDPDGAVFEWIPKVNDDGSISYIAEAGDTFETFVEQFGTDALNDIVGQNLNTAHMPIEEGFTMFSNTLYKMDVSNSNVDQIAYQILAATKINTINKGYSINDILYNYKEHEWAKNLEYHTANITLDNKSFKFHYRLDLSNVKSKIDPFINGVRYNSKGLFGKDQFSGEFKLIGNGDFSITAIAVRYHSFEVHNILNKYTGNRFYWAGDDVRGITKNILKKN